MLMTTIVLAIMIIQMVLSLYIVIAGIKMRNCTEKEEQRFLKKICIISSTMVFLIVVGQFIGDDFTRLEKIQIILFYILSIISCVKLK